MKFKNMSNIFMSITNLVKFNSTGKNDIGVNDLILSLIKNYLI